MRKMLIVFALFAALASGAPLRRHRVRAHSMRMEATAFSRVEGPTSAGTVPHRGIVAADPSVLPLGSRIRITKAGALNGTYTVTDTGGGVKGRHVDIYVPSQAQAKKFGKKMVNVQVLHTGEGKEEAREKDIPAKK